MTDNQRQTRAYHIDPAALRRDYERAVKERRTVFVHVDARGVTHELLTDFAKYVLEYLEGKNEKAGG